MTLLRNLSCMQVCFTEAQCRQDHTDTIRLRPKSGDIIRLGLKADGVTVVLPTLRFWGGVSRPAKASAACAHYQAWPREQGRFKRDTLREQNISQASFEV